MNDQIHFIDPIVVVPSDIQPVDGFFSSIGSAFSKIGGSIGTAASKLGTVFKSPVMSKLLEGGIAVAGGLLVAKAQSKAANAANAGLLTAPAAPTTYTPPVTTPSSSDNTQKYLLYGGAALAAITLIVLVTNRRRK